MESYRERLWPAPWVPVVIALAIPASMLVLAPINLLAGLITGVVLASILLAVALITAPAIVVGDGMLRAGSAKIPVELLGEPRSARGVDARHERGPGLDARAHLVLRGDVDGVVTVPVLDAEDPVPYWLISSRHPEALAAALAAARAPQA